MRGTELWDMSKIESLKGIMISDSKKMLYNLEQLQYAPNLEELLLFSTMFNKYPVKTITPLKNCKKLKRLFIEFNTEDKSFFKEEIAISSTKFIIGKKECSPIKNDSRKYGISL